MVHPFFINELILEHTMQLCARKSEKRAKNSMNYIVSFPPKLWGDFLVLKIFFEEGWHFFYFTEGGVHMGGGDCEGGIHLLKIELYTCSFIF